MATSFRGWGDSWLNSWGQIVTDPNAMYGSASFSITASLQVNAGEMQGSASMSFGAFLLVNTPSFSQEVELKRKFYIKRKKQILVFNTAQEADDYLESLEQAEKAIQEAQKTSRRARQRLRRKIVTVEPIKTVDIDLLSDAVSRFDLPTLPNLIEQQDFARFMQILAIAQEMQEEEDIELLLLA
jgi:transcription initiation factor TFIID subunit TAF12